jgi:hypothetical protein
MPRDWLVLNAPGSRRQTAQRRLSRALCERYLIGKRSNAYASPAATIRKFTANQIDWDYRGQSHDPAVWLITNWILNLGLSAFGSYVSKTN